MEASGSSIVCSADVAAFVDALETINYNEAECYDPSENVVICISEQENLESASVTVGEEKDSEELSVTDIEDSVAAAESGSHYFNPDTRKLKAVMQRLVAQKKAVVVKKTLSGGKGSKQFKSDVWNWFGDIRLFISESDAERLKIPYYIKFNEQETSEAIMICKVFVGCFRCNALFMYDAQKHSTSTLRYHVRACNRPKECIFVSEDKMDDEPQETPAPEKALQPTADGSAPRTKRFRTDPRKQKEVIEQLFQKQRAVVTRKSFMNMKGNRRFKSDVWNWFGDIKLLISRSEAKQLKIPYYIRRCGDEQMVLSKVFVGCFKCMALFIHDSQKSTSTLRYHIRTCSRPKERKKRTTPNIIFFPNKRSPKQPGAFTDSDAIQAHEKLLNFALSTESPLDVIQDPEFQKMLQLCITVGAIYGDVNVDSLLCATPTLTSFVLNDLYVSSVNAFYTEFQHAYGATYKPLVWIDEQMKAPFVSVHCSYADPEGQLKTVVLHTDDFDYDTKTPAHLKEWFTRFLSDQPVIPFKRILCIDNDSSMEPAFKDEMTVKCVVQNLSTALQLVATKGTTTNGELPDFTSLLGNCIDIVDYFESISEHCQVPQDLVKCGDDKWTSILALFASVDAQYDSILNVLNDTGATHLLSAEKATVSGVVEFLRLFEEAVVLLSSTTEPTLNLVIPWVTKLQKKLSSDRGDSVALKQLKNNVHAEFNERVVKNLCILHQMATLLDPRFKKLSFGSTSDHRDACTKVKNLVKECMEEKGPPEGYEASKCQKAAEEEVDKYLASSFTIDQGSKFSVLAFWQEHLEVYPNLCRIAQWLLTCPASSNMGCETFSSNYWMVHCPRLPIEHDNVNKVLFVKSFKGL